MKNIKNIIMSAAVFATTGFGLSSCDIDMLPLNEVVLENFWTDKSDVESVVTSCYAALKQNHYVRNMAIWGEGRSDNVVEGNAAPSDARYLLKGSLKTTNSYCDWSSMYVVINRCNTVLQYAPEVAQKDPNYTESEMRINIAECKFLRAMSYFTLIKTFKDVPFSFEASIDDSQNYRLPQTKFETIIDTLIQDLEGCKDYAPNRYSLSESLNNTGRVTRTAMYALLADLYLWRASDANIPAAKQSEYYSKCVECCDFVLNYKLEQYKNNTFLDIDLRKYIDKEVYNEYGYPLLAEETTVGNNNSGPQATNSIFGDGGSFEAIFEIAYRSATNKESNADILDMYGTSSSQWMVANEQMMTSKPDNSASYSDQKLFSVPSDYRSIASYYYKADATDWNIFKYVVDKNEAGTRSYGKVGSTFTAATEGQSKRSDESCNWIIYRLSEIMLMRAEAEIELANNMTPSEVVDSTTTASAKARKVSIYVPGTSLSTSEELLADAFNLISAVYRRSNPAVKNTPKYAPQQSISTDIGAMRTLLMNERRREFLFEGKRYYDLVRLSRREGNTRQFRNALTTKYGDAGQSVAIKMIQMDFMYMPVLKSEMKVNPELVQNKCYLDEEENSKN